MIFAAIVFRVYIVEDDGSDDISLICFLMIHIIQQFFVGLAACK